MSSRDRWGGLCRGRRLVRMNALAVAALAASACWAPESGTSVSGPGSWRGEILSGEVTTVRTLDGLAWDVPYSLDLSFSLGAEEGADGPLFGALGGVAVGESRIYAVDNEAQVVRVYDLGGRYVGDIGGPGEGPGEFRYPKGVGLTADGRLLVQDNSAREIHVFDASGQFLESWRRPLITKIWDDRFLVTPEGKAFIWELQNPGEADSDDWAMTRYGQDGLEDLTIATPAFGENEDYVRWGLGWDAGAAAEPFAMIRQWAMTPDGTLVVAPADEYQLEIRPLGGAAWHIERAVDRVAVQPGEFEWAVRNIVLAARAQSPGWEWTGSTSPDTKPFVKRVYWGGSGTLWVLRELEATRVAGCATASEDLTQRLERPCWKANQVFEVFDADGRLATVVPYTGRIHQFVPPVISDDAVLMAEEDANGNAILSWYRLVPGPGDEGPARRYERLDGGSGIR